MAKGSDEALLVLPWQGKAGQGRARQGRAGRDLRGESSEEYLR
jgi:hypothetical protein